MNVGRARAALQSLIVPSLFPLLLLPLSLFLVSLLLLSPILPPSLDAWLPQSTMLASAPSTPGATLSLSPAESRGRQIFLRGVSAAGRDIVTTLSGSPVPTPMACASCHGRDGRGGREEGGVRPADLGWDVLTRATASRPAYTAALLRRAVAMGIDAGGRRLGPAMPRYQLMRDEADDLVAWLERLRTWRDPGVGEDTLRLRAAGPMRPLFLRWAAEVNARGGIYARRIVIVDDGVESSGNAGGNGDDDAFALLGAPDREQTRRAIAQEVPLLRTGDGVNLLDDPRGPWLFELGPSPEEEARRLLDAAAARGAMPVSIPPGRFADLCRAPRCQLAATAASARATLVLDPRAMPDGDRLALVPSTLASDALPLARGDALIAARILPTDIDQTAAAPYALADDRLVDQWSALAITRLTEHALVRAGRDLTRERFVLALTEPYAQATGFSPPVTFGPTRRHGIALVRLLRYEHATGRLTMVAID